MIDKNPGNRKTAEIYLSQSRGSIFPEYFYSFLQSYMQIFSAAPLLSPDEKINRLKKDIGNIINMLKDEDLKNGNNDVNRNEEQMKEFKIESKTIDEESEKFSKPNVGNKSNNTSVEGLVIITQLVTSCIRGLHHSQSKLQSLEILIELAENTSDEIILDRILPYIVSCILKIWLIMAHN